MDEVYTYIPYLVRLEEKKGILSDVNLYDIDPELKAEVADHLKNLRLGAKRPTPKDPTIFFLALFTLSAHGDTNLKKNFLDYYIKLASNYSDFERVLSKYYKSELLSLEEYVIQTTIYPYTIPLYMLTVENGTIRPNPYYYLHRLALDIQDYMVSLKDKLTDKDILEELKEIYDMTLPKMRGGKKYRYCERLLQASGIEDGKRRIIYHWLAPYLITIKRLSKEEAITILQEWASRQSGKHIPIYWIRAEVESVMRKQLVPWSLKKVLESDKQLEEILKNHGIIN